MIDDVIIIMIVWSCLPIVQSCAKCPFASFRLAVTCAMSVECFYDVMIMVLTCADLHSSCLFLKLYALIIMSI